jgi:hypothetical protein
MKYGAIKVLARIHAAIGTILMLIGTLVGIIGGIAATGDQVLYAIGIGLSIILSGIVLLAVGQMMWLFMNMATDVHQLVEAR